MIVFIVCEEAAAGDERSPFLTCDVCHGAIVLNVLGRIRASDALDKKQQLVLMCDPCGADALNIARYCAAAVAARRAN